MEFESRGSCCDLLEQEVADKTKSRVEKIVQKLKFLMSVEKPEKKVIFGQKEKSNDSKPTDMTQQAVTENYGSVDSLLTFDLKQSHQLMQRLQETLRTVRDEQLKCEILVPCGLIKKVTQDVIHLSYNEPCGLRGCTLFINLEEKNQCKRLAKLSYDPQTVSTFELHLTLKEETRRWCFFKKLFISLSGCMKEVTRNSSWKLLCSSYQLEKKKLYRKN